MKKQSGFTLIELMVVMAIIAILATAGLSAYTSYIKEARDTTRLQIAKQLGIKVEQLSNISGAPTADQLEAFLAAENFGYKLPEIHPVIAKIADSMDSILGRAFALPDIDPLRGKPVCLDENNIPRIVCGFSYFQFSDGTYAIGYAVEKEDNKVNFLFDPALSRANATDTYASFIGNSPIVTLVNGGNSSAGTGVSIVAALNTVNTTFNIGSPISIASAKIVSEKNGHTNTPSQPSSTVSPSSTDPTTTTSPPTTIYCSSVGQVCSDGTVYVSSTLRTTPSDTGTYAWSTQQIVTGATSTSNGSGNTATLAGLTGVYPAADYCAGLSGVSGYGHDDWYLPAKDELAILYTNRTAIGGFTMTSFYWSSTQYDGNNAWYHLHISGNPGAGTKTTSTGRVRCVRNP